MSVILNKANVVGDLGDEGLSVGGRVEKGEIPEVKLQAQRVQSGGLGLAI